MKDYLNDSRSALYSFLFVLPLLGVYEFLIVYTGSSIRNGADVLVKLGLGKVGLSGLAWFTAVVAACFLYVIRRDSRRGGTEVQPTYFPFMLVESGLYALVLGPLVAELTTDVLSIRSLAMGHSVTESERLIVSLGAGIYEELVFRYFLISVFTAIILRGLLVSRNVALGFAVFFASLVFSGFHYVGAYAYPFDLSGFLFRFIAGAVLSILYLLRGYGIAVYSHALYDLILAMARG